MYYKNLIIDATNIEFRVFYIAKNLKMINANGEQTSCIHRFLLTFKDLVTKFNPDNIYACWDKKLTWPSTNFRKETLKDQYKAGRTKPADIQDMYDQEEKLIEVLKSLGVKNMFPNVLEADDVISWITKNNPGSNLVVSVDQDLYQLVDDNTSIYNLKKVITKSNFESEVGIPLNLYKIFKAIKGDSSDNIQGLPGYGPVRAKKLAEKWDSSNIAPEFKDIIERNLKLIDLDYGYLAQPGEGACYLKQFQDNALADFNTFKALCERYEFKDYLNRINEWKQLIDRNKYVDLINIIKES